MGKLGQSPAEFIIVIFAFFIIVIFIFTSNLTNTRPEAEKIQEQGSCVAAQALTTSLLKEPGEPANWNSGNIEVFGLTNGTQDFVLLSKWLEAQNIGFADLHNKTFPESSWLLTYQVYGFKLSSDSCPAAANSTVICRGFNFLNITANSTTTSTLELDLFFPFTSAVLSTPTLETDDSATLTSDPDGDLVKIILNTNSTDQDSVGITLSTTPDLIFVKKANYETSGKATLPILLNDTQVIDGLGSGGSVSGLNNYCNSQNNVVIVKSNENLLARFDILAW